MMRNIIYWIARLVVAIMLLQTLFFKFTGADESVEIFTRMGMEPWGRIGMGVLELITAILILIPSTVWLGSIMGLGLMTGALASHAFVLGIEVQGDGGQLFIMAVIVFISALFALWNSWHQVPYSIRKLFG